MDHVSHRGVVFLADDEDSLRDATQELLEHAGYLVLPARDGIDALARMRGIPGPMVAIVDLVMPAMNGWELIATMRADAELADIPIIVITATGRDAVEGADRLLRKPYAPATLLTAVRELCRPRQRLPADE